MGSLETHPPSQAAGAVNNVNVVNSILEDNAGPGIVVVGGFTVNLEGNTIESSGGPAIVNRIHCFCAHIMTCKYRYQRFSDRLVNYSVGVRGFVAVTLRSRVISTR